MLMDRWARAAAEQAAQRRRRVFERASESTRVGDPRSVSNRPRRCSTGDLTRTTSLHAIHDRQHAAKESPGDRDDNCKPDFIGLQPVGFPSVDAPFQARENVGVAVARGRMLSSVRPLMRQDDSRRPVWEFAASGSHTTPASPERSRDQLAHRRQPSNARASSSCALRSASGSRSRKACSKASAATAIDGTERIGRVKTMLTGAPKCYNQSPQYAASRSWHRPAV